MLEDELIVARIAQNLNALVALVNDQHVPSVGDSNGTWEVEALGPAALAADCTDKTKRWHTICEQTEPKQPVGSVR